jgi:hypothetical protein
MKRIQEIGVFRCGDLRVEVVTLNNLEETINGKTAAFVGQTTVTSRINGQYFRDCYHISRSYLKQKARWRVIAAHSTRVATSAGSRRIM